MPLRILVRLSLLCLTLSVACAQTADDFFHGGAQNYLSNNIPGALETVTNGLQRFPDDAKLKRLYELLNQQQQQQNQQDQKPEQSKEDQKQKPDSKPDPKQKDSQKPDSGKPDKPDQKSPEQKQKDQQQKEAKSQAEKKGQEKKPPAPAKSAGESKSADDKDPGKPGEPIQAHAMTPQEAQQLLDAQKGDEQVLQFQPQVEPKNQNRVRKDW